MSPSISVLELNWLALDLENNSVRNNAAIALKWLLTTILHWHELLFVSHEERHLIAPSPSVHRVVVVAA